MTKYFSPFYFLTSIMFVILLLGQISIYLSKKAFSFFFRPNLSFLTPLGLLFFLKNYLVIFGAIFLGANIYISGIDATFTKGPQFLSAQEEYENEIPYEEVHYETLAQEETSYEVELPPAPEESTYAYPEPEQSYSEALLPEAQPDPIIAYPEPQIEQYSYVELLPADDIPQYAYQAPQYEEISSVADLPPAEEVPTYAYQEPIYEQPVVAEMPGHTDMPQDSYQTDHQTDMNPIMTMPTEDNSHQQMPFMDPNMMNGNEAIVMDTSHMPGITMPMNESSVHNGMSPIASDNSHTALMTEQSNMPSMNDMNHPAVANQGMDMTSSAPHQMVMPLGQMQTVMTGHDGSATMTIPSMTHDQMNGNMDMGHTSMTNNSGMTVSGHTMTQATDHGSMNMGNTQMTMPSNHNTMTSTTHTMDMTSGQTGMTMTTFGTSAMTDHNLLTMPTSTSLTSMTEHSTGHTSLTTTGAPMAMNHQTDINTPMDMTNHQMTQTSNPTYNAFHNEHQTNQTTTSDAHSQHTLTTTPSSNQIAMTDHSHPSNNPTNSPTTSAQPKITSHDGMQMNTAHQPVVVASEHTNIKELPKTGVSSLILLSMTTIISLLYLKKRSHQIEIMTANALWTQRQLGKSINN
jgi:hypothetical protein